MKKFTSLIMIFLLALVLSGCDLIDNDTIDKATEELCRDNPENALCQGDGLADLEESLVLDLFNDMIDSHGDMDADEFCDKYISITNVELLDSCRSDVSSLFPVGIENFEVVSVVVEGDTYIVNLQSKTDAERLSFTLKTKVDGTDILVDEWSFGDFYVSEPGVNMDEVLALVELLIADLEDESLTDEQVCSFWDGMDNDCDGIEDARRKFKAGAALAKVVNILDTDDDDDGVLTAEVSFTVDGHVTVVKISFTVDNSTGELKLTFIDTDSDDDGFGDMLEGIEKADIRRVLDMFIADLLDPTKTDEEVCSIWYGDGIDNDCDGISDLRISLIEVIAAAYTVDYLDEDDDNDGLVEAAVTFTQNGHVTVLKLALEFSYDATELKLVVVDSDVEGGFEMYLTALESLELFNLFVADYLDITVTNEELNMMYFDGEMDEKFFTQRLLDIEEGIVITVLTTLPEMNDDGFFIIEIEISKDGVALYEEVNIKPIRLDLAIVIINFGDMPGDEVFELLEIEELWNDFLEDYLDATVTFEDLNMMYFNGMLDAEFMETRLLDLERGITITTVSVMYSNPFPDSFFDIEIEIDDNGVVTLEKVKIRVNRIDMALYLSFDNYGNPDMIPYDDALLVLDNYRDHYNHMSMDSSSFCTSTVVEFQVEQCAMDRDMMVSDGFMMTGFELYEMDDHYMVDFTYEDAMFNQIVNTKMVYFIMNEDGLFLLEFYESYEVEIDNAEIELFLENLIADLNNPALPASEICPIYFHGGPDVDEDCDDLVARIREGGRTIGAGQVEDYGNLYTIELTFTSPDDMFSEFYDFYFYYEDMILKADLLMQHVEMEILMDAMMFFEGLNDFTIPVEEVCSMNIHEDAYLRCVAIRDFHVANNYYLMVTEMYVDDDMNNVIVVTTFDNTGVMIEENMFYVYYMMNAAGENPLYVESVVAGNNPLYE